MFLDSAIGRWFQGSIMGKLQEAFLRRATIPSGIYSDGHCLYLKVQGKGRSWVFIYTDTEKRRREMGLGGYPAVNLIIARKRAQAARDLLADERDPIAERRAVKIATKAARKTLASVCREFIQAKVEPVSSPNVVARYNGYVANHLNSVGHKAITNIGVAEVEALVKPRWSTPTGPYLRSFLERVIDYATVKGYRERGLNPAAFKGHLEHVLAAVKRVHVSHAAMPWKDVPALMTKLRESNDPAAPALRFTILCGLRQSEGRELRWSDIREDRLVIPAARYKTRREHVVPLSAAAKSIIASMRSLSTVGDTDALVFPGTAKDRTIYAKDFGKLVSKYGADCTVHGFRSSFAVWCVEAGGMDDDIAQRCLGHVVGSAVTRAYQRSDFYEQKKAAFDAWGEFVSAACA